jgi:hypothetical protein
MGLIAAHCKQMLAVRIACIYMFFFKADGQPESAEFNISQVFAHLHHHQPSNRQSRVHQDTPFSLNSS